MVNMFDHPLIKALVEQRNMALNNCAFLMARVAELEAQIVKQAPEPPIDLARERAAREAPGDV